MRPPNRSFLARLARAVRRAAAGIFDRKRRSAFGRELFFRLARRFTATIEVRSGDRRFFMSTSDHGVGMTLFMGDDEELVGLERAFAGLEAAGNGRPGGTVADVGAHVGTVAVTALYAFGFERALCFEPSPVNRRLLEVNLLHNGVAERAAVFPVALSDRAGTARFEVAPMNPSDGRVRVGEGAGAFGEDGWETIEVDTATLDSLVREGEVSSEGLGLVWIDAQGHEGHILAGARETLAGGVPTVIEFWPYGLRRAAGLELLFEIVAGSYSSIVDLGEPTPTPLPAGRVSELERRYTGVAQTDLLLIP